MQKNVIKKLIKTFIKKLIKTITLLGNNGQLGCPRAFLRNVRNIDDKVQFPFLNCWEFVKNQNLFGKFQTFLNNQENFNNKFQ